MEKKVLINLTNFASTNVNREKVLMKKLSLILPPPMFTVAQLISLISQDGPFLQIDLSFAGIRILIFPKTCDFLCFYFQMLRPEPIIFLASYHFQSGLLLLHVPSHPLHQLRLLPHFLLFPVIIVA